MTDDGIFTIICNLDCVSVTGWKRIVSYIARKERTDVISLLNVALLHAANALPRSATFGATVLGGVDSLSLDKIRTAHARFPALHDVVVELKGNWGGCNVAPGLQLLPPLLARFTSITLTVEVDGGGGRGVVPGLQLLFPRLASFTSITLMSLRFQGLVSFPASLCALSGLKKLDLCGNKIVALPDAIGDLKELTDLIVGGNELTYTQPY